MNFTCPECFQASTNPPAVKAVLLEAWAMWQSLPGPGAAGSTVRARAQSWWERDGAQWAADRARLLQADKEQVGGGKAERARGKAERARGKAESRNAKGSDVVSAARSAHRP
eukprot:11809752-Alexandrium_andersonii.AAC.1